ncbi:MAG: hypothetical protein JWM85_2579 [Acidimicrobiaceae bacterium]|nr:hypothetical protein [Acidimicrobiaceae bacterium]
MRVLVVGTVPPPGGEAARALALAAADLAAEGNEIEVLSPEFSSAAHRQARLDGFRLPFQLAAAARDFDALVLRIQPGLPFRPDARRLTRAAILALIGLALRGYSQVTIYLDTPVPIPWGLGGRPTKGLWSRATTVVVENAEDRKNLLAVPGMDPDRVLIAPRQVPARSVISTGWSLEHEEEPWAEVLALVRSRAATTRKMMGAGGERAEPTSPFDAPAPPGMPVHAAGLVVLRKVLRRLRQR